MKALRNRLLATAIVAALATPCAAIAAQPADLLIYNAKVLTVDRGFSIRSAVAVKGGKIIAVGSDTLRARYKATKAIDLGGRTLLPGFTDSHVHPVFTAPRDIAVSDAHSIPELQAMLRKKAAELGPGEWITGAGWQEANLAEKRNITRADLDAATPDNPVVLTRAGGHSSVGNTAALKLARIDRSTPDPKSGLIEHGPDGEPNGIIRERNDLYRSLVPQAHWEEVRQSYIDGLRWLLSLGITSLFDASGSIDDEPLDQGGIANPPPALTFRRLRDIYAKEGDTLPRVTMYLDYPGEARLKAFGHHTGYGDEHVRMGPIGEAFVDGGFTGPTAWLLADYKGQPGFRGKGRYTDAEYDALVRSAAALGWQMGVHAIGDAAIVQAVNAFAKGLAATPGAEHKGDDRRWFLNHFTVMPPEATMRTMRDYHIAITQQPNFLYNLEERYTATLDDWRLAHNNSVGTPHGKYGLFVAFSSDNLPIGPLVGLYAAITRMGPSGKVHGPEEAVSRAEAIRMYTANGPYLSWEEKAKGTIEPGKYADMIVLPFDPLTADPKAILEGKVDMTFVAGKLVYDRAAATR